MSDIPMTVVDTSSLWTPEYLDDVTAWAEHAPFAFWALGALKPRIYVELGTHTGYSYFAVCQAVERHGLATRCFAVDTWEGDEHAGYYGEDVYERVSAYDRAHYSHFSSLIKATFDEAIGRFTDGSIDLLHIDGRHFYEDVRHDFDTWAPKLSDQGVVLFHDTNVHERGFGVHRLWAELRERYPSFEFVHGHGLGVIATGSAIPAPFRSLFELEGGDAGAAIRAFYARLGSSLSTQVERRRLEEKGAELQRDAAAIPELRAQVGALRDQSTAVSRDRERLLQSEAAARARMEDLVARHRELAAERDHLAQSNAVARADVERLSARTSELEGEREQLARSDAVARADVERLTARTSELEGERDELHQLIEAARSQIDDLRGQVENLLVQVQEISSERAREADAAARALAETSRLEGAATTVASQRDEILGAYVAVTSTSLGRLASGWARVARRHPRSIGAISRPFAILSSAITLRWSPLLRPNPLFDAEWYTRTYPDVPRGRRRAHRHYRRFGVRENRNPNTLFDTGWYLSRYDDVRRASVDPLDHYLVHGWVEGRDPGPDFNTREYLSQHLELVGTGMNPLLHRLQQGLPGETGGVAPSSTRPSAWRRALVHYRRHGFASVLRRGTAELLTVTAMNRADDGQSVAGLIEEGAGNIHASLDTPDDGSTEASTTLPVAGWACAHDGITTVRIYIDDRLAGETTVSIKRPDVEQTLPDVPGSLLSGYAMDVGIGDLRAGDHMIKVALDDGAGHRRVLTRTFKRLDSETLYHRYYHRSLPSSADIERFAAFIATTHPLPEIVVWVEATEGGDRAATLRSLVAQTYPAWRCNIIADASQADAVELLLDSSAIQPGRDHVRVVPRVDVPSPMLSDSPTFHGFLRPGETLAPHALVQLAINAASSRAEIIYSDHDGIDPCGRHVDPVFGPDWSPDHLLSRNHVGGFYLVRASDDLRACLADISTGTAAWRFDMLLQLTDRSRRISHIPRVLWSSLGPADGDAAESDGELAAVRSALERRGHGCTVAATDIRGVRRVRWPSIHRPTVSIIVPTTGKIDYVRPLIESLTEHTAYPTYDLLFLDNGRGKNRDGIAFIRSRGFRVVERDEPFNWAKLNNDGARLTAGELLLFLNDDIEIVDGTWLDELVSIAIRPGVGAVGPLLLYPDGSIQHAGVFLVGHGGGAMHWLHKVDPTKGTYLDLHAVAREVTATTGACLLVKRALFNDVGGFDERLPVVGNDIDLCLRLSESGHRTIWTPHARLIHHESVSRGHYDIADDETRMWQRWRRRFESGDPHYNPNLTQIRADASIAWERVENLPDPSPGDKAAGVNLTGHMLAEMGVGEAARGLASALWSAEIPFVAIDYSYGNPARHRDHSWLHKIATSPHFDIDILHINADVLLDALTLLPRRLNGRRYTIGAWAWELPEFPDKWRPAFDVVDEVWTPSTFVHDAIAAKSPVPVFRVPHAIRTRQGPFVGRDHFGLPEDRYQFLVMYDKHSIRERKNPEGAISAFCDAFAPDDPSVSLVIKSNHGHDDDPRELRDRFRGRSNIHVIDRILTRSEVDSLIRASDCFVSLHRSEGFGLVIAEAMALGKPVIVTNWSGNADFTRPDNAACVDYRLIALEQDFGPYKAGQVWADPDLTQASSWMRRLTEDRAMGEALGQVARQHILAEYGPAAVGRYVKDRIEAIRRDSPDGSRPERQPARADGAVLTGTPGPG